MDSLSGINRGGLEINLTPGKRHKSTESVLVVILETNRTINKARLTCTERDLRTWHKEMERLRLNEC